MHHASCGVHCIADADDAHPHSDATYTDALAAHAPTTTQGEHYVSVPQKQLDARKGELTKLMKESQHATKHFVSSIRGMEAILQQQREHGDGKLLPGDGVLVPHLLHGDAAMKKLRIVMFGVWHGATGNGP
jgi:hypothetical protein